MIPDTDLDAWEKACSGFWLTEYADARDVAKMVDLGLLARDEFPRVIDAYREQRKLLDWAICELLPHYCHKDIFYEGDPHAIGEPEEWWKPFEDIDPAIVPYLEERDLLEHHPKHPDWIRIKEKTE